MEQLRLRLSEAQHGGASPEELLAEVEGRVPELERTHRDLIFRIEDARRPGE